MNLNAIITLLQLVLALLMNPATATNPQVIDLSNQAVSLATQALSIQNNQEVANSSSENQSNNSTTSNRNIGGIPPEVSNGVYSTPTTTFTSFQLGGIWSADGTNNLYTGQSYSQLYVILYDQNGNKITNASTTITTDGLTSQSDQNGKPVPNVYTYQKANGGNSYYFKYYPPFDGGHAITISALGTTLTVIATSTTSQ